MFLVLLREQRWISKRFLSHINNLALSEQFLHLLANVSGKMCFKSAPQICIMKLQLQKFYTLMTSSAAEACNTFVCLHCNI